MPNSLTDVIAKIDFNLLYQQKMDLILAMSAKDLTSQQVASLTGILNLLDALGDAAEQDGKWTHPLAH